MSDGPGDCARDAERRARKWLKDNYPDLVEFNPYHVPYRGDGFVIYETHLDHNVEIIKNHRVIRCLAFKAFSDKARELLIGVNDINKKSIASGSRIE